MGLLDRLLGREPQNQNQNQNRGGGAWYESGNAAPSQPRRNLGSYGEAPTRRGPQSEDERAIARYRYMLRTAPPETIEQAHAEAFAQLTPEQRQMVLNDLHQEMPESERGQYTQSDPQSLARTATRAEMRRPGTVERALGRNGGQQGGMAGGMGMGMGGMIAGSLLGSVAGVVIGSAIANSFFNDAGYNDETGEGSEAGGEDVASEGGEGDAGADAGADSGGDFGGDSGGDFGGGDFGGGDFGGGDFGGGDF